MFVRKLLLFVVPLAVLSVAPPLFADDQLDQRLMQYLQKARFTGRIESTLEKRLGRRIDSRLATLGRDIFFDTITGLHDDNNCSGCHSPTNGFGDTQPMAIGVDNNGVVGPGRQGPRNQRRSPLLINTAFYPRLMWNGRFAAPSGDPFDNSKGYSFPAPEGTTAFRPFDPIVSHLLIAQAHIPPTEITEAAGFTGTGGTIGPQFDQFDNGKGDAVPLPDASGFRNAPIREAVLARFQESRAYMDRFAKLFPEIRDGQPLTYLHIARALAEFEFTLTFADAPIDRFARGERGAMSQAQKRGAILFFGKAGCVSCHAVSGQANEMFSDFQNHVIGVPQIAPKFGTGQGNVQFDGDGTDEDFGLEQVTGNPDDRYKFRTAPLRNLAVSPAFFHNGAMVRIEDAVVHHLDVLRSARAYDPVKAGVPADLAQVQCPIEPVLERLDPRLSQPVDLTASEVADLVAFVRDGLLDPRALPQHLCKLVPKKVPSGRPVLDFEICHKHSF
jgi:cytochrome c peroxidase